MSVSSRIQNMMELRGLTINDIARATGLSISAVKYAVFYKNRTSCYLGFVKKLANALGCTPGWLLQDKEWLNK